MVGKVDLLVYLSTAFFFKQFLLQFQPLDFAILLAQTAVVKTEKEICNAFDLFVHISVFTFFGLL